MKLGTLLLVLLSTTALAVTPACDDGAEGVGEKVDEAADDVGDAIEDAADEVEDAVDGD